MTCCCQLIVGYLLLNLSRIPESYSTYEEEDEESEDYDDDDVALRITYESPMSKVTPETVRRDAYLSEKLWQHDCIQTYSEDGHTSRLSVY